MRWNKTIAGVAAVVVGIGFAISRAQATDWPTRGGNSQRTQASPLAAGPVADAQTWTAATGATGSQPVFIGEKIYHLAGDTLWEIGTDGSTTPVVGKLNYVQTGPDQWALHPSTSGLAHAIINGQSFLYFGTGNNKVCSVHLTSHSTRCVTLDSRADSILRLVTTPLVFKVLQGASEHDIVIMGDKAGRVWAIQDLAMGQTASDVSAINVGVGGWVLTSPVQIGDLTFAWANDQGDVGHIGAYRVTPQDATHALALEPVWPLPVNTAGGVADGFAQDGAFIYASSTHGTFYRINTQQYKVFPIDYSASAGPVFANASPAYDDTHVYFAIRNVGTATPSTTAPGRLVALDRSSFQVAWTADLPAPANTNPLVWTAGPNVVLVGDTKGVLHAFDRTTGAPSPFGVTITDTISQGRHICTPLTDLDLGATGQAGEAYQTLTGVSEPILASGSTGQGLLLVGVSGLNGRGELDGELRAFRAGGAYNISVSPATQLPPQALSVGQPYTLTTSVTLHPWGPTPAEPRATGVTAYWVPTDPNIAPRSIGTITMNLAPETPADVSFTFTPTEADGAEGELKLYANPEQLIFSATAPGQDLRTVLGRADGADYRLTDTPHLVQTIAGAQWPGNCQQAETELLPEGNDAAMADNTVTVPVTIQQAVDLSVHGLSAPTTLECAMGTTYPVSWSITNPSGRTLTGVPWTASAGGRTLSRGVTVLPPGDTARTANLPITTCGQALTVRVEVNLGPEPRPVTEPDYSNNAAQAGVTVAAAPADLGGFAPAGTGHTLIVPADCQTNPDPTSPQPCLNYPNLIMP